MAHTRTWPIARHNVDGITLSSREVRIFGADAGGKSGSLPGPNAAPPSSKQRTSRMQCQPTEALEMPLRTSSVDESGRDEFVSEIAIAETRTDSVVGFGFGFGQNVRRAQTILVQKVCDRKLRPIEYDS